MDEDKDIEICSSSRFSKRIQENFNLLRSNEQLFDFEIHVDNRVLRAHKYLLATCSDHFRAMFLHDSQESQENKVVLEDIDADAVEAILDFCYAGQLKLSRENVQGILLAANRLAIDDIQNLCVEYIRTKVDTYNCLGVLTIADRCNLAGLSLETFYYCLDKFEIIIKEEEFLNLDENLLEKIISHDQLNINDEQQLLEAVIKWFYKDPESREVCLDSLIRHIRFSFLTPIKLVQLSFDDFFQSYPKFHKYICEAKDYLLLKDDKEHQSKFTDSRFRPRSSLRRQQRIFAVGGWTNDIRPIRNVEKYDPYSDIWEEVNSMTKARCGVGVTILGDSLYAIGGHDGHNYLNNVERYDIPSDTWFGDVAHMSQERTSVGVVSLNGFVYAIGGQQGSSASAYVERYDPKTNTWEERQPLGVRRLGAGVTVLGGFIYVLGGAEDKSVFATVERYDPATNRWAQVTPMLTNRKHLGCASCNGRIYAVGGRGTQDELSSAECYDPELDRWDPIPDMSMKRSGVGLVELDGLLYAVGGHNGDKRLELVEAYDPQLGKWSLRAPMIFERLGGGLAVHSKMISPVASTDV